MLYKKGFKNNMYNIILNLFLRKVLESCALKFLSVFFFFVDGCIKDHILKYCYLF